MSDFFQFEADLRKDSSESILVIGDPDQVYGDSWLVCLTEGAQEREMGKMLEAERAAAALEEEIRLERERVEAQQRAAENAVYEDVPIKPKAWVTETGIETEGEVASLEVSSERAPLAFTLTRPVDSLGQAVTFADRAAENEKYIEFRAQKNPDFELQRKEVDAAVQASAPKGESGTQTWSRPTNRATQ